jgi:hypothetical protein
VILIICSSIALFLTPFKERGFPVPLFRSERHGNPLGKRPAVVANALAARQHRCRSSQGTTLFKYRPELLAFITCLP